MDHIYEFQIALEADDITTDVDKDHKKLKGNDDQSEDNSDRDITQTENIFGGEDDNDPNPDDNDDDQPTPDDDNDNDDDPGDGQDEEQDANNTDPSTMDDSRLKKKLWENMVLFHGILSNNIKILTEYAPPISNNEITNEIEIVLKHLHESRNILYRILTEELKDISYPELLKKYIALQRVYDICVNILQIYAKDVKLQEYKPKNKVPHSSRIR